MIKTGQVIVPFLFIYQKNEEILYIAFGLFRLLMLTNSKERCIILTDTTE